MKKLSIHNITLVFKQVVIVAIIIELIFGVIFIAMNDFRSRIKADKTDDVVKYINQNVFDIGEAIEKRLIKICDKAETWYDILFEERESIKWKVEVKRLEEEAKAEADRIEANLIPGIWEDSKFLNTAVTYWFKKGGQELEDQYKEEMMKCATETDMEAVNLAYMVCITALQQVYDSLPPSVEISSEELNKKYDDALLSVSKDYEDLYGIG